MDRRTVCEITSIESRYAEKADVVLPQFQELFSVSLALSGPASTKLLYCINLVHGGTPAAIVAFFLFTYGYDTLTTYVGIDLTEIAVFQPQQPCSCCRSVSPTLTRRCPVQPMPSCRGSTRPSSVLSLLRPLSSRRRQSQTM